MPESTQFVFTHKEVVEALIRKQRISSGIWGLYIKFGIAGANIQSQTLPEIHPAAIVPVLEIGLQKFDEENNISVDASRLSQQSSTRGRRAKH